MISILIIFILAYLIEIIKINIKHHLHHNKMIQERARLELIAKKHRSKKKIHKKFSDIKTINHHFRHPLKNLVLIEAHIILKTLFERFHDKNRVKIKISDLQPRLSDIILKSHTFIHAWSLKPNPVEKILRGRVGKMILHKPDFRDHNSRTKHTAFLAALWFAYYMFAQKDEIHTLKGYTTTQKHNLCRELLAHADLMHLAQIRTGSISLIKKNRDFNITDAWRLDLTDREIDNINNNLKKKRPSKTEENILLAKHELAELKYLLELIKKEIHIVGMSTPGGPY